MGGVLRTSMYPRMNERSLTRKPGSASYCDMGVSRRAIESTMRRPRKFCTAGMSLSTKSESQLQRSQHQLQLTWMSVMDPSQKLKKTRPLTRMYLSLNLLLIGEVPESGSKPSFTETGELTSQSTVNPPLSRRQVVVPRSPSGRKP